MTEKIEPATLLAQFMQGSSRLPPELRLVADDMSALADRMLNMLPPGPERTAGMRKLLEAKDCFCRAAL